MSKKLEKTISNTELKQMRRDIEFNQKQMASLLELKLDTYKKYEQGKRNIPKEVVVRLYNVLARRSGHSFEGGIDWLKIRFKTLDYKAVIKKVLKMKISAFTDNDKTFYGYEDMLTYGNIRVLFHHDPLKTEEGTLIEFTGIGCREFESILLQQKREWWMFLQDVFNFAEEYREHMEIDDFLAFTRCDIALDELYKPEGNIELHDFKARIIAKKIKVNTVGKIGFVEGLQRVKGRFLNNGLTINIGSRQSDVFIRFYQKDYEQAIVKKVPADYIREVEGFKNRYEIELHGVKAYQVIQEYVMGTDLLEIGCKILIKYFEVYDWDDKLDLKWQELVGLYGGYKFVTKPKRYDYSRSKKWLARAGGGAMLMVNFESVLRERNLLGEIVEEAEFNAKQERTARIMAEKYGEDYEEVLELAKRFG
ncbi:replication initiation factor domain-containing protein [Streptococcus sp. zg-JUN1979]|uniref:replication initiation factor domain-containing protein n=1 Tax=Streptococcus sp. zg-JUN1979 TaxID=3391450 RepID=UPI0039A43EA8